MTGYSKKRPSSPVRGCMSASRISWVCGSGCSIREVKDTCSPVAIFHKVEMVGLDSPRSICPSMLLLTPVRSAASPRLSCFAARRAFRLAAITRFISGCVSMACSLLLGNHARLPKHRYHTYTTLRPRMASDFALHAKQLLVIRHSRTAAKESFVFAAICKTALTTTTMRAILASLSAL